MATASSFTGFTGATPLCGINYNDTTYFHVNYSLACLSAEYAPPLQVLANNPRMVNRFVTSALPNMIDRAQAAIPSTKSTLDSTTFKSSIATLASTTEMKTYLDQMDGHRLGLLFKYKKDIKNELAQAVSLKINANFMNTFKFAIDEHQDARFKERRDLDAEFFTPSNIDNMYEGATASKQALVKTVESFLFQTSDHYAHSAPATRRDWVLDYQCIMDSMTEDEKNTDSWMELKVFQSALHKILKHMLNPSNKYMIFMNDLDGSVQVNGDTQYLPSMSDPNLIFDVARFTTRYERETQEGVLKCLGYSKNRTTLNPKLTQTALSVLFCGATCRQMIRKQLLTMAAFFDWSTTVDPLIVKILPFVKLTLKSPYHAGDLSMAIIEQTKGTGQPGTAGTGSAGPGVNVNKPAVTGNPDVKEPEEEPQGAETAFEFKEQDITEAVIYWIYKILTEFNTKMEAETTAPGSVVPAQSSGRTTSGRAASGRTKKQARGAQQACIYHNTALCSCSDRACHAQDSVMARRRT